MRGPPPLSIRSDELRGFAASAFVAAGLLPADAGTMADTLVAADLRGANSHGVIRLPFLVDRLMKGGANRRPDIRVVSDAPATALIDGDGALGPITACRAMNVAMDKAQAQGIAFVAARNSDFIGACAYYAMMGLAKNMIGIAWTNGFPGMAPWGGRTNRIGNNPIAFAAPGGAHGDVVIDMALSVVAGGRVRLAAKRNEKIPLDWVVDREGNPTDDPADLPAGGALMALGYKGYGLAVFGEILCGVLTGSRILDEVTAWFVDTDRRTGNGHVHIAIDIARFVDPSEFKRRVDAMSTNLKATPLAKGAAEILLPGERSARRHEAQEKDGVAVPRPVAADLAALARKLGVTEPAAFHEE